MRPQIFETQVAHHQEEISSLSEPINHLIALADETDSYEVAKKAAQIIDGMKDAQSVADQFKQLEQMTKLQDDLPQIHEVVTDTAEILLEELKEGKLSAKAIGLSLVWSAVHAWDNTRDEPTAELCVGILNNFGGEAQANLARAYVVARDKELPFDEALDQVNAGIAA